MIFETAEYNKYENDMIIKSQEPYLTFFIHLMHGKQVFVILLTFAIFYGSEKGKWSCSNVKHLGEV